MTDQLEALRRYGDPCGRGSGHPQNVACRWAANEIDRLKSDIESALSAVTETTLENDRLRAALKPFAEEAAELGPGIPDDAPFAIDNFSHIGWSDFTVGDLRRARAALAKAKQEGGAS